MIASSELLKAYQAMQKHAMDLAELNGKQLDYSVDSLENVDTILYKIYNKHVRGSKMSEQLDYELYGIALSLGCYIMEIIERNYGTGTWRRVIDAEGKERLPYAYENVEIMPIGWCVYALHHGSKRNIRDQFIAFLDRLNTRRWQVTMESDPLANDR